MIEQHRCPVFCKTYWEAERAVDHFSGDGRPVERVAIIGRDVRLVERVVGRTEYGRASLHGAASGALPGVLDRLALRPCEPARPIIALFLALFRLIFAAIVGALFGVLLPALQGRVFASRRSMQPGSVRGRRAGRRQGCVRPLGVLQTTVGGPTRT